MGSGFDGMKDRSKRREGTVGRSLLPLAHSLIDAALRDVKLSAAGNGLPHYLHVVIYVLRITDVVVVEVLVARFGGFVNQGVCCIVVYTRDASCM